MDSEKLLGRPVEIQVVTCNGLASHQGILIYLHVAYFKSLQVVETSISSVPH